VVLPPDRTIRWDIVLSPEEVQSLDMEVGDAARTLELTGDADGRALTAFEIRNYHVRYRGISARVEWPVWPRGSRWPSPARAPCL